MSKSNNIYDFLTDLKYNPSETITGEQILSNLTSFKNYILNPSRYITVDDYHNYRSALTYAELRYEYPSSYYNNRTDITFYNCIDIGSYTFRN